MKKILTTLVLFSALFFFKSYAQTSTTGCNANFNFQYLSGFTVKFNPVYSNDSAYIQHYWRFGDGTSPSNLLSPTHVYVTGVYTVTHYVVRHNPDGVIVCTDTLKKQIIIEQPACNMVAAFTSTNPAPLQAAFNNTSTGFSPGDSIRWTFGDGTVSFLSNPHHQYINPGTYTVCLRIKKAINTLTTAPCVSEVCHTVVIPTPTFSCNLSANFVWHHENNDNGMHSYEFENTSSGGSASDSIRWTFGDGTSSHQNNPEHVYKAAGTYNVCLRIIKRNAAGLLTNCISEKCYTLIVPPAITQCNLQVYFEYKHVQTNVVHFSNESSGYTAADSVTWSFGDGTISHDISPNHTFATPGTYNVCLKIKKNTISGSSPCVAIYCKLVTIAGNTVPCTIAANFTFFRDSLAPNLYTYHFNNTSSSIASTDSVRWTFGDGTSSNLFNPIHGYNQPGIYNVCLRVIKRNPNAVLTNCVSEKCYVVTVMPVCTLHANYSHTASTADFKRILFTNKSNATPNTTTAIWSFGDGTVATTWNAEHTYNHPGKYNVCLQVKSGNCISYKCDSVKITEPAQLCNIQSGYSYERAASNNNNITFKPAYISNDVHYTWTFGDGTGTQTTVSPTHQFATSGYYTVCLTAFKNNSCATTTCKIIYVTATNPCSSITLNFNDVHDPLMPNRIKFVATSNTPITDQLWKITKLPTTAGTGTATIHTNNPTYVFLDSGYYNVCLRTTYANGCVKELCKIIHIAHQLPFVTTCNLQVYPNPVSNYANVSITLAKPQLLYAYIYNSMNMLVTQKVQQGFVGTNTVTFNIGNLPSGIYRFRIVHGNDVCTANFIK